MEFNTLSIAESTKRSLRKKIPKSLIQKKKSGKSTLDYISGATVIQMLNDAFGFCWSWEILSKEIIQCEDKVIKTKYENGQSIKLPESQWTYEKQMPVAHVTGRLTVWLEGADGNLFTIHKEACGSQPLVGGQNEQENCFKGASTDALKKAATYFEIGLELYQNNDELSYFGSLHADWSAYDKQKYETELAKVKKYVTDNSLSGQAYNLFIYKACGEDTLLPSNINKVCEYIDNL